MQESLVPNLTRMRSITLTLDGVFSGFVTSEPDVETLGKCDDAYMLTPTRWNPHDHEYRLSEESMLDWKGEMMEKKRHSGRYYCWL